MAGMPRNLTRKTYPAKPPSPANHPASQGFTLVELLVTIAMVARAVGDIHAIGTGIIGYQIVNRQYPATLADIGYGANLDPWGNPYQYLDFANVKGKGPMRKDRFLVPINTYFDLYSMGKDGQSVAPLTAKASQDDIIWANDGDFVGLASDY